MTKITFEISEDLERRAKLLEIEISILAAKAIKEQIEKLEKIKRIREIAAKSQASDEDVEEITNEVKEAIWKHYEKYAK